MASTGERPYCGNSAVLQSTASVVFNPNVSDTEIPLTAHQQWDKDGRAVGYTSDPMLYVPQPQRAPSRDPVEIPLQRPENRNDPPSIGYRTDNRTQQRSTSPVNNAYLQAHRSPPPNAPPDRAASPALHNPFDDPSKVQVGFSSRVQSTYLHSGPSSPSSPQGQSPPMSHPSSHTLTPAQFAAYQQSGPTSMQPPMTYTHPYPAPIAPTSASPYASAPMTAHAYEPTDTSYQTAHSQAQSEAYPYPYDSTTSVQSQAGSLPPTYSSTTLR